MVFWLRQSCIVLGYKLLLRCRKILLKIVYITLVKALSGHVYLEKFSQTVSQDDVENDIVYTNVIESLKQSRPSCLVFGRLINICKRCQISHPSMDGCKTASSSIHLWMDVKPPAYPSIHLEMDG